MLLKHSFGLFLKVELKIHFAILLDSAGLRDLTDQENNKGVIDFY